jgi:hypothetical protein
MYLVFKRKSPIPLRGTGLSIGEPGCLGCGRDRVRLGSNPIKRCDLSDDHLHLDKCSILAEVHCVQEVTLGLSFHARLEVAIERLDQALGGEIVHLEVACDEHPRELVAEICVLFHEADDLVVHQYTDVLHGGLFVQVFLHAVHDVLDLLDHLGTVHLLLVHGVGVLVEQ